MNDNLHSFLLSSHPYGFMFTEDKLHRFFSNHIEIIEKLKNTKIDKNYEVRKFVNFISELNDLCKTTSELNLTNHARIRSSYSLFMSNLSELFDIKLDYLVSII